MSVLSDIISQEAAATLGNYYQVLKKLDLTWLGPLTAYDHLARLYAQSLSLMVRLDVEHLTLRRGQSSVGRNDRGVQKIF